MRLILHPKVYSDIDEIMQYYERIAKPELAHEFYAELRYLMTKAGDTSNPSCSPSSQKSVFRIETSLKQHDCGLQPTNREP